MDGKQQQQQQRKIEDHLVQVDCFKEDTYELPNDKARHCDATLHTTPTAPNKQELEPSRVNVSKKSDVADMEATELMAANIFASIFCCFCLGIAGIVMAYKSRIATKKGNAKSAKLYLYNAKLFYWTAVVVGQVIWMVYIKLKDCA